jgi:hypothetical protein
MQAIWLVLLLMLGLTSESTLVEPHGNKLSEVADKGQQRLSTNNTLELGHFDLNSIENKIFSQHFLQNRDSLLQWNVPKTRQPGLEA